MDRFLKPVLTEPGVKYFIGGTLNECRKFKDRHLSLIFNISTTISLILVISFILIYRYKGNPTPAEVALKNRKKQEYIVSKLQQIALAKKKNSMLTNLPISDFTY
jgi:hypothetical protein